MATTRKRLDHRNKVILAPMVRIGTLPMRLLALDYGADIVYTEELIDWKLLRSTRRVNDVLGTIDYVDKTDGTIIFRTCSRERDQVVLQIGTSDAERALKVAQLVEQDVAAIDINMGCPKTFSVAGGMGAALLQNPTKAHNILKKLVDNLKIPVSCKIRVLSTVEETLQLCDLLVSSGISAIAVHGRTTRERPQHLNRNDYIKAIAGHLSIPVIANGGSRDIEKYSDIIKFKESTGCDSVMIARAAEWNCSIFRKQGLLPMDDVIKAYLKYAVDYDNSPSNTKYCIQNILRELQDTPLGRQFLETQTLEKICEIWQMDDYYKEKMSEFRKNGLQGRFQVEPEIFADELSKNSNKRKFDDDVTVLRCAFLRRNYSPDEILPKTRLLNWTVENRKKKPVYETIHECKLFQSVVTIDGKKYGSSFWEKNKRWAEQGAAMVCLYSLGIISMEYLIQNGNVV